MNMKEHYKKYQVQAGSVAEFLDKYYKNDRYWGRGEEYAECLLNSYEEDVKKNGYTIISHHDSATGKVVSFYS